MDGNSSLLYERRQTSKIAFARITFLLIVSGFLFLLFSVYKEYCILIAAFLFFLMFPTITELKLFNDKVEIRIYYGLGIVYRTYHLKRTDLPTIFPFDIEIDPIPEEGPLFLGTLLFKHYQIKYTRDGKQKRHSIRLTDTEYKKIITILN